MKVHVKQACKMEISFDKYMYMYLLLFTSLLSWNKNTLQSQLMINEDDPVIKWRKSQGFQKENPDCEG
jgi:hypothetical protein